MKYIDVTKTIKSGMPKYPTDPDVDIKVFKSLKEGNSCNLSAISFGSHSGTHIDAPLHVIDNGSGVDKIEIADLICNVLVSEIDSFFDDHLFENNDLNDIEGVLFKETDGVSTITAEQAEIIAQTNMKVVGTEAMSIEASGDKTHPVHDILLKKKIYIVESLELRDVNPGKYKFICLPLKIENGDGAPVRAVLVNGDE